MWIMFSTSTRSAPPYPLTLGTTKKKSKSYEDDLQYFNPFSDIGELGTRIEFSISDDKQVDVDVHINGEEVIPNYELKQTAGGKLSKKNMTKSKFNELYQDHIYSSIIRVSRELYAYLPLDKARVNAIGQVLNLSTGHLEERPILSVIMVPKTTYNEPKESAIYSNTIIYLFQSEYLTSSS